MKHIEERKQKRKRRGILLKDKKMTMKESKIISKEKIIIDTDIGTDVDDALAIAYAIKSGLNVGLITTAHGDALLRAKIATKFLKLCSDRENHVNIPIIAGEDDPLILKQRFWTGMEGENFIERGEEYTIGRNAPKAIADYILANKNNVSIVSIAPPTNIAKAFQLHPELAQYVNQIYMMGNAIVCEERYHLNYRAHNFKVDPHATDIIFNSGVPITLVTTEVCKQNHFTRDDFKRLAESGEPLLEYLAMAAEQWLSQSIHPVAYLYDPLVVHHLIDDDCTEKREYGSARVTTKCRVDFKKMLEDVLLDREK